MTSFLSEYPELSLEWSDKNPLGPEKYAPKSKKKVWWNCRLGHEWMANILNRANGSGCPVCSGNSVLKGFNDLATTHPHLSSEWSPENDCEPYDISYGSTKKIKWLCPNGHTWEASPNTRTNQNVDCHYCSGYKRNGSIVSQELMKELVDPVDTIKSRLKVKWLCDSGHTWVARVGDRQYKGSGCPHCSHRISRGELEVVSFLKELVEVEVQNKSLIAPLELDIYVPSKSLAIEYNGVYWHSEKYRGKTYHYDKWEACRSKGVQLVTVWEDQWLYNQDVVKKMLAAKLGAPTRTIGARKTRVVELTYQECAGFLRDNHIQGPATGKHYLGLVHQKEIVAVSVITARGEVRRYASNTRVVGGLDKMMKHTGIKDFYTFADHCVSDGSLYEKTGWTHDGVLPPDYMYLVDGRRVHKFNYRIKRFKSDPDLKFYEGMTERQLAEANDILRVYDCGKTRYVKSL